MHIRVDGVRIQRCGFLTGGKAFGLPKHNPTIVFMPAAAYDQFVQHIDWNGEYIPDQWDAWIDAVGREVRGG